MRRSTDRKCLDEELHRYVRTERPFHEASVVPSKKLPELPDMRLMTEYAQSWPAYCERVSSATACPVSDEPRAAEVCAKP